MKDHQSLPFLITREELGEAPLGQRWLIRGLSQEEFHKWFQEVQEVASQIGLNLGEVFFVPEQTGMIIVIQKKRESE